jgi:cation transport protein ChaC
MSWPLRLTPDHVRRVHREVEDSGAWPGVELFTEERYDAHLRAFLQDMPEGPVGVFAYGSLIWKPAFEPAAVVPAVARGWHRAFCLRILRFRGTPDCPGLMMALDRGGSCEGMLHLVPEGQEWEILSALWRREMTVFPPTNLPRWIEVEIGAEVRRAIAFTGNAEGANYAGVLSPGEVAETLSQACGHWGTGADYLLQTVTALEAAGIHDPHLWDLQERVADLIEARLPA